MVDGTKGTGGWEGFDAADDGYLIKSGEEEKEGVIHEHDPLLDDVPQKGEAGNKGGEIDVGQDEAEFPEPPSLAEEAKSAGRGQKRRPLKRYLVLAGVLVVLVAGGRWYKSHNISPSSAAAQIVSATQDKLPVVTVKHGLSSPKAPSLEARVLGRATVAPNKGIAAVMGGLSSLKTRIGALEVEITALRTQHSKGGSPAKEVEGNIQALQVAVEKTHKELGVLISRLSAGSAKHPVKSGYRLLAVIGDQAVMEDMATRRVSVLRTNGSLGGLSVYQITKGAVVTNYGVFSSR